MKDGGYLGADFGIGASVGLHDVLGWRTHWTLEKRYVVDDWASDHRAGDVIVSEFEGNVLANGGADVLWERLITVAPSTATNVVLSAFSTLAALGVGNSTATATAAQTDLQGTKLRRVMDSGFPTHSTGTSTSARSAVFKATFSSSQANFAWQEVATFNAASTTTYRMLNRKVSALGTKTSAAQWALTETLTFS
jgi:hypothetical protein